jgi:hypothetical protein
MEEKQEQLIQKLLGEFVKSITLVNLILFT